MEKTDKKQIIKRIREIEITSNILAENIFAGEYHSHFKGNGIEFNDIRRYSPGDDIKKIDWKVTARQRKAYVKEFVEERELSIYILVDMSASLSSPREKELISMVIGSLSFSASKNNDRVGAILFTETVERFVLAKKGKKHCLSILDDYLSHSSKSLSTKIESPLDYLNRVVKKPSIVFLISDYLDSGYERSLKIASRKHDIIPICITNKKRAKLPKGAIFTLRDSETGQEIIIENLKRDIVIGGVIPKNSMVIDVEDDYVKKLSLFFKGR